MGKHTIKKCMTCNQEMQKATGCMTCAQETVMKEKVKKVMGEFKKGELHSRYETTPVTNRDQAIAIALSEGRKEVKKGRK